MGLSADANHEPGSVSASILPVLPMLGRSEGCWMTFDRSQVVLTANIRHSHRHMQFPGCTLRDPLGDHLEEWLR